MTCALLPARRLSLLHRASVLPKEEEGSVHLRKRNGIVLTGAVTTERWRGGPERQAACPGVKEGCRRTVAETGPNLLRQVERAFLSPPRCGDEEAPRPGAPTLRSNTF